MVVSKSVSVGMPVLYLGSGHTDCSIDLDTLIIPGKLLVIQVASDIRVTIRGGQQYATIIIKCGPRSHIHYVCDRSFNTDQEFSASWYMAEGSHVIAVYTCLIMAGYQSIRSEFHLQGVGAQAVLCGRFMLADAAHLRLCTKQIHTVPDAKSLVRIHSIIGSDSMIDYVGGIEVAANATNTEASQLLKGIPIADSAKMVAIPTLNVLTNNVKCSHGAAIATLDQQSLYYIQTRGIEPKQARRLLLEGFLVNVCQEHSSGDTRADEQFINKFLSKSAPFLAQL